MTRRQENIIIALKLLRRAAKGALVTVCFCVVIAVLLSPLAFLGERPWFYSVPGLLGWLCVAAGFAREPLERAIARERAKLRREKS